MKSRSRPALYAAAALALAAGSASAQEVVLKFHHIWPTAAMAPQKVIGPWCDKIAAESNNRMRCQLLPAMSGGGTPPQLVDRVKDGVDDLVVTLPGYTAGRFPRMEVFELPFMVSSAEQGAQASWDYYQKHAKEEFPGTKILATWVHDPGFVHTSSKPVNKLEDFRGLKMRAPTRQTNKLLGKLGATPVGMPVTGVADALSKGTIDGYVLPWEVIPAFKLHEMSKYHTETDPGHPALYTAGFIFAMNQAKYDSLPADLKKVIDDNSGAQLSRQIGKVWDESRPAARKLAEARSNNFIQLSPAETDRWVKASDSLYQEWVRDLENRKLPGKEMLKDARDLLAKYKGDAAKK
ncbi:TRAP transporter substrate-binding protein [Ramlibacter sp. AN1015]|uniref:TRAP transporter substrate-binding protein n=1 Tax=Ramlibacter sp. AN1015 TaxID=3133428 RepID=UPI0030C10EDD